MEKEKNISAYIQAKQLANLNIQNDVIIKKETYSFSQRILNQQYISMMLPDSFIEMDPELARIKYPSEFRPDLIITDKSGGINFTFSYLHTEDLTDTQVPDYIESLRMASKRMNPASVFMEQGFMERKDGTVAYYESRDIAFDADIYSLTFLTSIHNHILLGGFNCLYSDRESWSILVKQMLPTIKELS